MKKVLVATLAAAMLLPTLAMAQGTISFGTATPNQRILLADGVTGAGAGVAVELWWSPDNILPYTLIANAVVAVNGFVAPAVLATTGGATPAGSTAWFYVYATDGAFYGQTSPFQNATGNPGGEPPSPPATLDGWTSPVVMNTVIPEPTTMALAGLGVAALLAFRRRS